MEAYVKDLLYRLLAECIQAFIWGGDVVGEENLPEQGPAVLVANHLGALGPVAVVACVPRRLHPWVREEVMDPKLAPEYLRWDFVERELHLPMPFSLWLAKIISMISVPLLNRTDCIPVRASPMGLLATFNQSVDLLTRDGYVVVFPEDPTRPSDPQFGMSPFKKGFVRLGEMYFQRSGRALKFYPLAVHAERRTVQVGIPVVYNPYVPLAKERLRIKHMLENMIREMLVGRDGNFFLHIPLPH
jgi:1-acyl-sn-glycerol-3-phosphate acyltransferase